MNSYTLEKWIEMMSEYENTEMEVKEKIDKKLGYLEDAIDFVKLETDFIKEEEISKKDQYEL